MKVFFVMVLAASAASCQITPNYAQGFRYERDRSEAGEYIDLWKTPERTLIEGGDCEDWALLVKANRIKSGQDPKTMSVELWKKNGSNFYHAVLNVGGELHSNHGYHGQTVRGYTYISTYSNDQIESLINKGKVTKSWSSK